jgi:hypothetical protein
LRTAQLGQWCACARNERGLVYIVVGGRLRVGDVTPVTGARAVWAALLGDVQLPWRPMAHGGRRTGECGLATWHPPAAVNVTHRSTPAQRSDRWTFRTLGVRARRVYGAYGGADDVSSPGATSCAGARVCTITLIYPFSHRIFSRFQNRSGLNFEHQSCSTSYQLQKCQRI